MPLSLTQQRRQNGKRLAEQQAAAAEQAEIIDDDESETAAAAAPPKKRSAKGPPLEKFRAPSSAAVKAFFGRANRDADTAACSTAVTPDARHGCEPTVPDDGAASHDDVAPVSMKDVEKVIDATSDGSDLSLFDNMLMEMGDGGDPKDMDAMLNTLISPAMMKVEPFAGVSPTKQERIDGDAAPKEAARHAELKKVLDNGVLNSRSSIGQLFQRATDTDPNLMAQYKAVGRSYEAQRLFKLRWCEMQFKAMEQKLSYHERSRDTEGMSGTPMLFSQLLWEKKNKLAAINYVKSCIEKHKAGQTFRGKPYVSYDDMTKNWTFMHVTAAVGTLVDKTWQVDEHGDTIQLGSPALPAPAALPALVATAPADPAKEAAQGKGKGKPALPAPTPAGKRGGKGGKGGKAGESSPADEAKQAAKQAEKKGVDEKLRKCKDLKSRMEKATSQNSELREAIDTQIAWQWARGHWATQLASAKDKLNELKLRSEFWHRWGTRGTAVFAAWVKQTVSIPDIAREFALSPEIDKAVANLEELNQTVEQMQQIATKKKPNDK